jgi:hypothetical protein
MAEFFCTRQSRKLIWFILIQEENSLFVSWFKITQIQGLIMYKQIFFLKRNYRRLFLGHKKALALLLENCRTTTRSNVHCMELGLDICANPASECSALLCSALLCTWGSLDLQDFIFPTGFCPVRNLSQEEGFTWIWQKERKEAAGRSERSLQEIL